jgi:hypothetical protein
VNMNILKKIAHRLLLCNDFRDQEVQSLQVLRPYGNSVLEQKEKLWDLYVNIWKR